MMVRMLMAMTIDGKIAKDAEHAAMWTSKADKKIFVEETKKAGVIIMGRTTYDTIGRPLPGRLNIVMTRTPDASKNIPGVLEFTSAQPRELVEHLSARGYASAILGGGSVINSLFLKEGLIDELWVTVEPRIFGTGISMFKEPADAHAELMEIQKLNAHVIQLRYRVAKQ